MSDYTRLSEHLVANHSFPHAALPEPQAIATAISKVATQIPAHGLGDNATHEHLLTLTTALTPSALSANYYGFVTGGVLPIAAAADNIVTACDHSVAMHSPKEGISTYIESQSIAMLCDLLDFKSQDWRGLFTTGATASNILGLACGREQIISRQLKLKGASLSVGELGLIEACQLAGIAGVTIYTSMGHSSLTKAASIVGIGRKDVLDLGCAGSKEPWRLDLDALEATLERETHSQSGNGRACIVSISAGEVNTGRFATAGFKDMVKVRQLCDRYGAWLHVDGAFGIFARSLPNQPDFLQMRENTAGLELADSIAGDCHKMLNVPYDCGFFLIQSKHIDVLASTFQNSNAAYLTISAADILSPLNAGLENSRRFRAFPVYAVLLAHGRAGLASLFERQVQLARKIASFIDRHDGFELLAQQYSESELLTPYGNIHIIVLFRAKDSALNDELVGRINAGRSIYVSGTLWEGTKACRFAISTWRVDVDRDLAIVEEVLSEVAARTV